MDLLVLSTGLSDHSHAPFFFFLPYIEFESLLKAVFEFCCLQRSVMLGCVLPGRTMIKALALSLICYLVPALLSSLYFGNHLVKTINYYTFSLFSSKNQRADEMNNGTFPFFSCGVDVVSLFTITLQYLEHPWVAKILILTCFKNMFPAFPKVN